ncbi:hypothetical protein OG535_28150 [Kitasatospora sp. NBC_00085]|uniref:hypothetical protein n=1 Tax=Kitasatospora sp. NBC_00085 TaxID=2903566 RepID=UPI00324968CB
MPRGLRRAELRQIEGRRLPVATITGDGPCYATNVSYRLDTPVARAFLTPFVALP